MGLGGAGNRLQQLREAIQGLELAAHGDAIAEARELLDRLEAVIATAEAGDTASGLAEVEGFANTAAFERHPCRMTLTDSRRVARRAARVAAWPELGEAWRAGRITGAHVELASATIPDRHVERFAETRRWRSHSTTRPSSLTVVSPGLRPQGRRSDLRR